jgi:hypothetical protein
MIQDVWDFFVAVFTLHFVLLGGCVLTVLVALWEKYLSKRGISKGIHARVILFLLFFACFQAWQQEHQSKLGRERDLHTERGLTQASTTRERHCQAVSEGKSYQINSCLVQLGKAQQSEPLRVVGHLVPGGASKRLLVGQNADTGRRSQVDAFERTYVVVTNRILTPVRLVVSCEGVVVKADGNILGTTTRYVGGWGGRLSAQSFGVGILSPAWAPTNPMLVTVMATVDPVGCRFSQG